MVELQNEFYYTFTSLTTLEICSQYSDLFLIAFQMRPLVNLKNLTITQSFFSSSEFIDNEVKKIAVNFFAERFHRVLPQFSSITKLRLNFSSMFSHDDLITSYWSHFFPSVYRVMIHFEQANCILCGSGLGRIKQENCFRKMVNTFKEHSHMRHFTVSDKQVTFNCEDVNEQKYI